LRENNLPFWEGSKSVVVNPIPLDARLSIIPWEGNAFEREFLLNTTGWIVRHNPA
jgi:hypothetical protein